MGIETATYVSELTASNPAAGDTFGGQAAAHLRLIKSVLLNSFPNISGAVTASHTELNYLDGVTSAVQDQLNAKLGYSIESKASGFTASVNTMYTLTFSGGTVTLPASPAQGDFVILVQAAGSGASTTVARNGKNIMGAASNSSVTVGNTAKFVYVDSTTGWARCRN